MSVVDGGGSSVRLRLLGLAIGLFGSLLAPAAASAIDEFPVPAGHASGRHHDGGPDGNLWFTEEGDERGRPRHRQAHAAAPTHISASELGSVPDR